MLPIFVTLFDIGIQSICTFHILIYFDTIVCRFLVVLFVACLSFVLIGGFVFFKFRYSAIKISSVILHYSSTVNVLQLFDSFVHILWSEIHWDLIVFFFLSLAYVLWVIKIDK